LMKDRIDHNRAAELIAKLNALVSAMMFVHSAAGGTDPVPEETMILALDAGNLIAHYLYEVMDATKETAPNLIQLLLQLTEQVRQSGDPFYAGFFFALAELLSVKFELGDFGKKIERQKFERSLKQTVEKYGLGQAKESKARPALNGRTQPTGYVV
jgi:hypothetical protein